MSDTIPLPDDWRPNIRYYPDYAQACVAAWAHNIRLAQERPRHGVPRDEESSATLDG